MCAKDGDERAGSDKSSDYSLFAAPSRSQQVTWGLFWPSGPRCDDYISRQAMARHQLDGKLRMLPKKQCSVTRRRKCFPLSRKRLEIWGTTAVPDPQHCTAPGLVLLTGSSVTLAPCDPALDDGVIVYAHSAVSRVNDGVIDSLYPRLRLSAPIKCLCSIVRSIDQSIDRAGLLCRPYYARLSERA